MSFDPDKFGNLVLNEGLVKACDYAEKNNISCGVDGTFFTDERAFVVNFEAHDKKNFVKNIIKKLGD